MIRPAVPADLPRIAAIARAAFSPFVAAIGRPPAPMVEDFGPAVAAGRVAVAERDGRGVGFLCVSLAPDHLLLEVVAVDPEAQGAGLGRALVAEAERRARAAGLPEVRLYTNSAMTGNLSMYPRLGYAETARRREAGFERVFFLKRL